MKLFEYVLLLRPAGPFTTPKGAYGYRDSVDRKRWPHGVVQYTKPLSKADVKAFDLHPLDPADPINMRLVADAWVQELQHQFGETEVIAVDDSDTGGRLTLSPSTRPGVDFQVTFWRRVGRAKSQKFQPTGHLDLNDFQEAAREMLTREERARLVARLVPVA